MRTRGQIISDVYYQWSKEQANRFTPAQEWATAEPSQYSEHADLMSSGAAAERDLLERTQAALEAASEG